MPLRNLECAFCDTKKVVMCGNASVLCTVLVGELVALRPSYFLVYTINLIVTIDLIGRDFHSRLVATYK